MQNNNLLYLIYAFFGLLGFLLGWLKASFAAYLKRKENQSAS